MIKQLPTYRVASKDIDPYLDITVEYVKAYTKSDNTLCSSDMNILLDGCIVGNISVKKINSPLDVMYYSLPDLCKDILIEYHHSVPIEFKRLFVDGDEAVLWNFIQEMHSFFKTNNVQFYSVEISTGIRYSKTQFLAYYSFENGKNLSSNILQYIEDRDRICNSTKRGAILFDSIVKSVHNPSKLEIPILFKNSIIDAVIESYGSNIPPYIKPITY